jgi:mitogen-activated protein kinase 1/3
VYDIIFPDRQQVESCYLNTSDFDVKSKQHFIFIVMECLESDLKALINNDNKLDITEGHIKIVAYYMLCNIKFVHSGNILHRDIKPSNFLVNKDCQVKMCDFGISRSMPESVTMKGSGNSKRLRDSVMLLGDEKDIYKDKIKRMISKKVGSYKETIRNKDRQMSTHVGSRWYRAPEISILEKHYDQASDMWSFGCCLFELLVLV